MSRGRPRKEIDQQTFEKLCGLQCTLNEIAGFFSCSEDTIERWCKRTYKVGFKVVWEQKSAGGKISLRRNLFRMSEKNASVAIWLSKQYLGMRDDPQAAESVEERLSDALDVIADAVRDRG